jgi:26S proteasome regulatory subunit N12
MYVCSGLAKLKSEVDGNNATAATITLNGLKVQIATTPAALRMTPPVLMQEREIYEYAVLLSVQTKDTAEFERHMALLTPYYTDFGSMLGESANVFNILGLNLLRLLAQNRIADFHTQLETIAPAALQSPAVQFPVLLEQNMMEGTYSKVLEMQKKLPLPAFGVFMDMLKDTLIDEVAMVSEKAYKRLPAAKLQELLMMSSLSELQAYAQEREWKFEGADVIFDLGNVEKKEVPATALIAGTLHYAKELERIV